MKIKRICEEYVDFKTFAEQFDLTLVVHESRPNEAGQRFSVFFDDMTPLGAPVVRKGEGPTAYAAACNYARMISNTVLEFQTTRQRIKVPALKVSDDLDV